MKGYYEWYLTDGTVLTGSAAVKRMEFLMENYKRLINDISRTLNRCQEMNHIAQEDCLPNTVIFTSEQLSLIGIELNLLAQRIDTGLEES